MTSSTWKKGSTTLGSETYTRPSKGLVDTVTPTGAAGTDPTDYGYDDRARLTEANTDTYTYDPASNLTERSDGTLQVFDPAQRLCWTSPTASTGSCETPPDEASTFDYDSQGRRVKTTAPSGNTSEYTYDQAGRLTDALVPDGGISTAGQYRALTPAVSRVADSTNASTPGTCGTGSCTRLGANESTTVQVLGIGNVPTSGAIAVTGTIKAINPASEGTVKVNPNGTASAAQLTYGEGGDATGTFVADLDSNGRITVESSAATDIAVDIAGYYTTPSLLPGANYWPAAVERLADTRPAPDKTGTCDNGTCDTLTADQTVKIDAAGVGGVPEGVTAVVVAVSVIDPTTDGTVEVSPSGIAAAGTVTYEAGSSASGVITAPVDSTGQIAIHTTQAVDIAVHLSGWSATPTAEDSGTALALMPEPTEVTDTANGTGVCDGAACDSLSGNTTTKVAIAGQNDVPADIVAAVVNIGISNVTSAGVLAVNADLAGGGAAAGLAIFEAGSEESMTVIAPVAEDGTISLLTMTSATVDVTVDVVGTFARPVDTYQYTYDAAGLRMSKNATGATPTEFAWDQSGGLPLLLRQKTGSQSSYLIYGPAGTPVYQITAKGHTLYFHQDQLGSTRLVTSANGNAYGSITYDPYGETLTDTTPWTFERPLLGYAGQYSDAETGLTYLGARYYDPTTNQFLTQDPLVATTHEPYGYVNGNPVNATDPLGLWPWDDKCVDFGAIPGVGENPDCDTRAEEKGGTFQGLVDMAVNDPGQLATIAAGGTCVVLTAGVCAVAAGGAWVVRSNERRSEGSETWVRDSAIDGVVTYVFFGLSTLPAAGATGNLAANYWKNDVQVGFGFVAGLFAGFAGFISDFCLDVES